MTYTYIFIFLNSNKNFFLQIIFFLWFVAINLYLIINKSFCISVNDCTITLYTSGTRLPQTEILV